jgi:chaperone required for assembly of F1-ATPase
MRKFYKAAEAGTAPGGYVIRLDGKMLKTPMQKNILLDSKALADAIAAEWNAQGDDVILSSMPIAQLVNTMIDKSDGDDRRVMNDEIVKYTGSDLVCYLATHPEDLVARHRALWLPLVEWMNDTLGVRLETVQGMKYHHQPDASLKRMAEIVAGLDAPSFTVVQAAMGVTGSAVMAFAILYGRLTAADAFAAAMVDEIYQIEKWGDDFLAQKKLDHVRAELETIARFRDLVSTKTS